MGTSAIIIAIDKELARLQDVRAGLIAKAKRESAKSDAAIGKTKRRLSAAGRARIAAAQRKRWAAARKGKNKK